MSGERSFSAGDRCEALRLRRQGFTHGEIGRRLGFSRATIGRQIWDGRQDNWRGKRLDEAAALRRQGWTADRIAAYLGFASGGCVRAVLCRLRPTGTRRRARSDPW